MSQNRIIICSGDSFTEGSELGGDLLIPGYTNILWQPNDPDRSHQQFTNLGTLVYKCRWGDTDKNTAYIKECMQRAWPAHLERATGIPTINVGAGEISNQEIVYRAIQEFFKIYEHDPKKEITVFLMLTSPGRLGAPKQIEFPFDYAYRSYMPGYISKLPSDEKQAVEYAYTQYTDDDLIWASYSAIKSCVTLLTELGANVHVLDSVLWRAFGHEKKQNVKWKALTKSLNIQVDFSMIKYNIEGSGLLAGRHYVEERHKILAQELLKLL